MCRSFAPDLMRRLGVENFVALYGSGAVLASLGSLVYKLSTNSFQPSLGASGAIMFMVSMTACMWPDANFGLLFLPGVTFRAIDMLAAIACLDMLGLARGWQMLDHAAHLTGSALGLLLIKGGGYAALLDYQNWLVSKYRKWRKTAGF